ncbi:MAG TPA: ABC transporter transmembrane domain-containing protein, partial [Agromyces mariniharenae]|nr:ABC transporter transmembrane domain-containing protein [Agromyces mariniharenae]
MHASAPGGQSGRMGKPRTRISGADENAQRAENADAPKIPHLLRRISELFAPHKAELTVTVILVLVGAALSVIPPLLTERAFDDGLFPVGADGELLPPNLPVLAGIVVAMMAVFVVSSLLGVWQTWLTANVGNKVMGALRVRMFTHLQGMELSFFTRTKT